MTTKKSTLIQTFEDVYTYGAGNGQVAGDKRGIKSVTVPLLTTDIDANDIIHLIPVRSDAVLHSVKLFNDDLDGNGSPTITANLGLYTTAGVVKDVDALASVVTTLQAANTTGVELRFEDADINGVNKKVWELAGDAVDPGGHYYLSITIGTGAATAAAGDITVIAHVG